MKLITLMPGLGDTIYSRPFVKQLAKENDELLIKTPYPELFIDIPNLKFVNPNTKWRTQAKSAKGWQDWTPEPRLWWNQKLDLRYSGDTARAGSIIQAFQSIVPVDDLEFDLPLFDDYERKNDKPIVVSRPVTIRREWNASTRAPRPEYIRDAIDISRRFASVHVVSIADISAGHEWMLGPVAHSDETYHHGELNIRQLISLIQQADLVVGGVGWILPAALAARVNVFCVLGGRGGYDHPVKLTDPRMDLSRLAWGIPDRFCLCELESHDCDKTISNYSQRITDYMRSIAWTTSSRSTSARTT